MEKILEQYGRVTVPHGAKSPFSNVSCRRRVELSPYSNLAV